MSTVACGSDSNEEFGWRQSAPNARRATAALYAWREPHWSFLWSATAAVPFLILAAIAPALLSLSPTTDMIAPIAEARAVMGGEADIADHESPFYLLLLMAGDIFAEAPGRIHLMAKALGALLVMVPLAFFASSRFPALVAAVLTAGMAAYVAAPFAAAAELGVAIMLVCAVAFLSGSAEDSVRKAVLEGAVSGALLFTLWLLNPVLSLAGFVFLSACPFLSGRFRLWRYGSTLAAFALFAAALEFNAPGLNFARATAAADILDLGAFFTGHEATFGLSGVVYSAIIIMASSAIFGGREHAKSWGVAAGFAVVAFAAARIAGANSLPVFVLAATIACFSIASPFYDGLFRSHDRASVSISLMAASLTLFWAMALITHAAGQFALQYQASKSAPENIRSELALVQPGGLTIARWVEEGRFSTPEARELFALAPVDQSAILLEAANRARIIAEHGLEVAILTGADTACVLTGQHNCYADGPAAATAASVVFVPRLDFDDATTLAKGRSEALLYTQFKLVERTPLWDIWVRRGASIPTNLVAAPTAALYR